MATTLSSSLSAIAAPSVQVGFSPEGTAQELVLKTINNAQSSVRMLGYNPGCGYCESTGVRQSAWCGR